MKSHSFFSLCLLALFTLAHSQPLSAPAPAPGPSSATSGCVLTPELTEGPYWLNDKLFRANITEGQAGIPFALTITVLDVTTCAPVPNAFIDVWHCNATGFYSGFGGSSAAPTTGAMAPMTGAMAPMTGAAAPSPGGRPAGGSGSMPPGGFGGAGGSSGPGGSSATTNETFLRGITLTNANGTATIYTIQPGWYAGRSPHIHLKVHVPVNVSTSVPNEYASSHTVHTGQFFFTDAHMSLVSTVSPYTNDTNPYVSLTSDGIYNSPVEVLNMTQVSSTSIAAGLVASVNAIVDLSASYTPTSTATNVVATSPSSAATSPATSPGSAVTSAASSTQPAATPGTTVPQTAFVSAVASTVAAPSPAVTAPSSGALGAYSVGDVARATLLASVSLFVLACF